MVNSLSTVVVLDLSLSMPMTGLWLPALSSAAELVARLRSGGGGDRFEALIGFGEIARVLDPDQLVDLQWDYTYGSNLAGALDLALSVLGQRPGQVVVFTDLEATAHYLADGTPLFNYPPSPDTVAKTVEAIGRYREGDRSLHIRQFVPTELPPHKSREHRDRAIVPISAAVIEANCSIQTITVSTPQSE